MPVSPSLRGPLQLLLDLLRDLDLRLLALRGRVGGVLWVRKYSRTASSATGWDGGAVARARARTVFIVPAIVRSNQGCRLWLEIPC